MGVTLLYGIRSLPSHVRYERSFECHFAARQSVSRGPSITPPLNAASCGHTTRGTCDNEYTVHTYNAIHFNTQYKIYFTRYDFVDPSGRILNRVRVNEEWAKAWYFRRF